MGTIAQSLMDKFAAEREEPTSMEKIAKKALRQAMGLPEYDHFMKTPAGVAIEQLSRAIDNAPPMPGGEPAYHNIGHFKEAVMAMGAMCKLEFGNGPQATRAIGLGVLSMVGHDFQHDGTINKIREGLDSLEAVSWQASKPYLKAAGMSAEDMAVVQNVIMGTDPDLAGENLKTYKGDPSAKQLPSYGVSESDMPMVAKMRAVANEADVCASMMPSFGNHLGKQLEAEWSGHPDSNTMKGSVGKWNGRVGFLAFVDAGTKAAKDSGLSEMRQAQLAAFSHLAQEKGLLNDKGEPNIFAAGGFLQKLSDEQGPKAASAAFMSSLEKVSPEVAKMAEERSTKIDNAFAAKPPEVSAVIQEAPALSKLEAMRAARAINPPEISVAQKPVAPK